MRIDVHAHFWPASYLDMLTEGGREDLAFVGRQSDDLSDRLAEMDTNGVDVQIFSAIGLNTVVDNADLATASARHINDRYVALRDEHGGRFTGWASVTLPFVDEAIAEADRALDELGLPGLALPCLIGDKPIDHADFEPFWEHLGAREKDTLIYVHPVGSDSNCHPGLPEFGLNMGLGSTMQIAMAALRLGLTGLTTRHPRIKFIFALCGGVLPYLWTRYETNLQRGIKMSAVKAVGKGLFSWIDDVPLDREDPMNLFRKNMYYDTSVQDIPDAIALTKRHIGVDRMLLGSDAIFASLTESVELLKNTADLSDEERDAVLDRNAQALIGLPPLNLPPLNPPSPRR